MKEKLLSYNLDNPKKVFDYVLFDFYNIAGFFKVKLKKFLQKKEEVDYENDMLYWRDLLGPYFPYTFKKEKIEPLSSPALFEGKYVKLIDIHLTDWIPRAPGRFWTKIGYNAFKKAKLGLDELDELERKGASFGDRNEAFRQIGHNFVLSGVGNVRWASHNNLKLLNALTSDLSYLGIPVITTLKVWDKVKNYIETHGAVHVESLEGYLIDVGLNKILEIKKTPLLEWTLGVPNISIFVPSKLLLKGIGEPDRVDIGVWNVYRKEDIELYYFKLVKLGIRDYEYNILNGVEALDKFIKIIEFENRPLFEIDEKKPRFKNPKVEFLDIIG